MTRLGDTEACAKALLPFLEGERKVPWTWEDPLYLHWKSVRSALRQAVNAYEPRYWGNDLPDPGLPGTPRSRAWKALHKEVTRVGG